MQLTKEIQIIEVNNIELVNDARFLFLEYAKSLDFSLCFQGFDEELKGLPGYYCRPDGFIYVAHLNNKPIGCIALRKLEPDISEIKRLYVLPEHRSTGLGRKLVQLAIEESKKIGYTTIKLDSLKTMTAAVKLYKSFGFQETTPYCYNPLEGAIYMELKT